MNPTEVKNRLETNLAQAAVEVVDLTGTRDHYQVDVTSDAFEGLSRMERHKLVMQAFQAELASGEVHALTIKAKTRKEATQTHSTN